MKKIFAICILTLSLSLAVISQRIDKPTLEPKPCTDDQNATIRAGTTLHDAGRYDEAIAKYQQVLSENPDCTPAMYELSMSYYYAGEKTKAMETAYKGSKYKSDQLPLFYLTMANVLDDIGKSDEAVRVYLDGIKMLEGNPAMTAHLSSLHFNLGVTYRKLKKDKEAREEMKRSITINYQYPSPNYHLAMIFYDGHYKIPAFLAAARFVSIEFNTERTKRAAELIKQIIISTAAQDKGDGKMTINLDLMAPTDEGNFGPAELVLSVVDAAGKTDDPKMKSMTPEEKFADRIDSLIELLDAKDKKNASTFSAKAYFPFMQEMKQRGYVKPFAYLVLYHTGDGGAQEWVRNNGPAMREFLEWAKGYRMP